MFTVCAHNGFMKLMATVLVGVVIIKNNLKYL